MTVALAPAAFDDPAMVQCLAERTEHEFDEFEFGVIGIDTNGIVRVYNRTESQSAGISRERVLGNPLFTVVAPCMNNYLVAQRLEDALVSGEPLDATLGYVFTFKMRPSRVTLRLLCDPKLPLRYVLVHRQR